MVDATNMKICAVSISLRRSNASASAPATSASITIGNVMDAWTKVTICADAPSATIIQAAPTPWIIPPKLEAKVAIHTDRKMPWRNGASADACSETGCAESFMAASSASRAQSAIPGVPQAQWRPA